MPGTAPSGPSVPRGRMIRDRMTGNRLTHLRAPQLARVTRVDEHGITLWVSGPDRVVDVLFDSRRIWSFWLRRDTGGRGPLRRVEWPQPMRRFLDGRAQVEVREHVSDRALWSGPLQFGAGRAEIAFVNKQGLPIALDKAGRFSPTFGERQDAHLEPLLDAIERVIGMLSEEGVSAFPAYGTLLGAVREGTFLGHDSDADLGYVSRHTTPVDVVLESFRLQRAVARRGLETYRYSGAAFKISVRESDGAVRGLDVFGGFMSDGRLYLMGEIGTEFRPEWIWPLSTCELNGRVLPAPAAPDRLLEATYGPSWRVPDPAFQFETSERSKAQLTAWFRGSAGHRRTWERQYSRQGGKLPPRKPTPLARRLRRRTEPGTHVLDVGAGRGRDALWLARQGFRTTAYDHTLTGLRAVTAVAQEKGLPLEARLLNLTEWRSILAEGARLARVDEPRVILARHVLDATDPFGRQSFGRFASMVLRGGGRLYAEVATTGEGLEPALAPMRLQAVTDLVERHGGSIVKATELTPGSRGNDRPYAVGRVIAEWT